MTMMAIAAMEVEFSFIRTGARARLMAAAITTSSSAMKDPGRRARNLRSMRG